MSLSVYPAVCLSSTCVYIYLSTCLSIHPSIHQRLFDQIIIYPSTDSGRTPHFTALSAEHRTPQEPWSTSVLEVED